MLDNVTYNITLKGNITHKINATGDMFISGADTRLRINGNDYTIDGNYISQSSRVNLFNLANMQSARFKDLNIVNVKNRAIKCESSDYSNLHFYNCNFTDADVHSGVLGEGTGFISVYGGNNFVAKNCNFKQTADPAVNQNRNPGGIIISGANANTEVEVTYCTFENLGHNVAGNLESPLDIYAYCRKVHFEGNTFIKSRFNPFRITNAGVGIAKNNYVLQEVSIINDGGGNYSDSSCFTCGIVGRGYAVNDRDNMIYHLQDNRFEINNVNCRAFTITNSSTLYKVHKLVLDTNIFRSTGVNTQNSCFIEKVKEVVIKNLTVEGFSGGAIRVQSTDTDALATEIASLKITGGEIKSSGVGLYARTGVSNLNIDVENVNFYANTGVLAFSIRTAKNVAIKHCELPSTNSGDILSNNSFYYYNNYINYDAEPVGYDTNTYYRLLNNIGRADKLSL